jgi:hypothetical protein
VFALIGPKGLLVEIPIEINRINADIGTLECALQEAPEILDVIGVDMIAHKLDRVVDRFVGVIVRETEIRLQRIGIDVRAWLDSCADLWGECSAFYIRDVRSFDPAGSFIGSTFNDPEKPPLCRSRLFL